MERKAFYLLLVLGLSLNIVEAKIYNCIDGTGQRIFSDKPCTETTMGEGSVNSYEMGAVEVKTVPVVIDDQVADKIRARMKPAEIKKKYCAKYTQTERDRLIFSKQVVLGMYLTDVIKVWGAPLVSDGNKVLFQEGEDEITITLIEGCVINIQRNIEDEEYLDIDSSEINN